MAIALMYMFVYSGLVVVRHGLLYFKFCTLEVRRIGDSWNLDLIRLSSCNNSNYYCKDDGLRKEDDVYSAECNMLMGHGSWTGVHMCARFAYVTVYSSDCVCDCHCNSL